MHDLRQIGEKYLANRRASEVVADQSFASTLRKQATQIGDNTSATFSSEEEEELVSGIKQLPTTSALLLSSPISKPLSSIPRLYH